MGNKNNKEINKNKNDWICKICKNLNYTFRIKYNKCKRMKNVINNINYDNSNKNNNDNKNNNYNL